MSINPKIGKINVIIAKNKSLSSALNIGILHGFLFSAILALSPARIQSQTHVPQISDSVVLIVSGGGARGAWGAGLSKALDTQLKVDYRYAVGTSTGALLAPFIAIEEFPLLQGMYTNLGAQRGAVLKPRLYNKSGEFTTRSKLAAFFKGKSISSSLPLLKLLQSENGLTQERYDKLKDQGIEVEVSAIGLELGNTRFRSSMECKREEFIHWMWASSNQPAFMTPFDTTETFLVYSSNKELKFSKKQFKKFQTKAIQTTEIRDGVYEHVIESKINWVDGGAMENIPIVRALEKTESLNPKDIFIIVNNKAPQQIYQLQSANISPFVEGISGKDIDLEYLVHAEKILNLVQTFTLSELEQLDMDQLYKLIIGITPTRISNRVDLSLLDIERLATVSTNKAASFDSDVFKIENKNLNERDFKTKMVMDKLLSTIDAFSKETFMNDLLAAIQSGRSEGKTFHIFFMPLKMYDLNPSSLYFNGENMKQLYQNGLEFDYNSSASKEHAEYFRIRFPEGVCVGDLINEYHNNNALLVDAIKRQDLQSIIFHLKKHDSIVMQLY